MGFILLLWLLVSTEARVDIYDEFDRIQFMQLKYCTVNLTQNHAGWSTFQPPSEWTNVTFNATFEMIQVTAVDRQGNTPNNTAGYAMGWTINYGNPLTPIVMYVNYWGVFETLYYSTYPAPCTRYDVQVRYGKRVGSINPFNA